MKTETRTETDTYRDVNRRTVINRKIKLIRKIKKIVYNNNIIIYLFYFITPYCFVRRVISLFNKEREKLQKHQNF